MTTEEPIQQDRPRVWVVHEPLRLDRTTGTMIPTVDLTPATEFGDLHYIISGERPHADPEASLKKIRPAMEEYMEYDYIVCVGDMALVSWAVALAARTTNGVVQLLRWNARTISYYATTVELWKGTIEPEIRNDQDHF